MREIANAMEMDFIYSLVPKDGTLHNLIERRAMEIAREIVLRTSASMKLEDQENSAERIEKAIKEKTNEIITSMPKYLWDR